MKKYKFRLSGLDCASCANKIENHLNKDENLSNVIINFSTATLSFNSSYKKDIEKYVNKRIKEVEPDVQIINRYESGSTIKFNILRLILGVFLLGISFLDFFVKYQLVLLIFSYAILLSRIFIKAIKLIFKGIIDENFLITISCIGAFLLNEKVEGAMVIILYEIGKILEEKAINKSRKSIASLIDIKPEFANTVDGDKINPELVNVGDVIVVKPGEKIPLDGIVIEGETHLDVSSLTGESKLLKVKKKMEVLSGSINQEGLIKIKVTSIYKDSTVSKILSLVENATDKKAKTENFVAKLSKIYTPIVISLALLVAVFLPIFVDVSYHNSIYRALTFLVISCPCAIVISIPLSYFSGLGASSRKGVLIKGSDYLDLLRNIKEFVFDKTGTLTNGSFEVTDVVSFNDDADELLFYAALGESMSNHPIALSIMKYYNKKIDNDKVNNYQEVAGLGISYQVNNDFVKIGNSVFVEYHGEEKERTNIFVKVNEKIIGYIILNDSIKDTAKDLISVLQKRNIAVSMFTGDSKSSALAVAKRLNINDVKYNMLPTDKYQELENKREKYPVAFVGDGINDSPVLALADIGISMGINGSSAAIEASDVVIMNDDLIKINDGINISKLTNKIIKQNLLLALFVKVVVLVFSVIGMCNMWHAIFADVGVTLITIFNTLRILRY